MKLTVHLFGDLRRHLPKGQDPVLMELPEGSTPMTVLEELGIHPGEVWVVRANKQIIPDDQSLQDGDELEVFEPIGGGQDG